MRYCRCWLAMSDSYCKSACLCLCLCAQCKSVSGSASCAATDKLYLWHFRIWSAIGNYQFVREQLLEWFFFLRDLFKTCEYSVFVYFVTIFCSLFLPKIVALLFIFSSFQTCEDHLRFLLFKLKKSSTLHKSDSYILHSFSIMTCAICELCSRIRLISVSVI